MSETKQQSEATEDIAVAYPAFWYKASRWVFNLLLAWLVVSATIAVAGRLLMPLVPSQRASIEQQLDIILGTEVRLGELNGDWFRYGPILEIGDLEIINPDDGASSVVISSLTLKPNLIASILSRSLVIDQVIINEPSLRLIQNENGVWALAGIAGNGSDNTDAIIDFLLATSRLQVVEASLGMQFADGRDITLSNIYIDLSNVDSNHLVQMQARIDGQDAPFQMQMEFSGDLRDAFEGSAHLDASELDLADILSVDTLAIAQASITGDIWLTFTEGSLATAQADIGSLTFSAAGAQDSGIGLIALNNAAMDISVVHDSPDQWQLWLENAEFDWQMRPWNIDTLYSNYSNLEESQPLEIKVPSLNAGMVMDIVDDLFLLPERASDAFIDLDPQGYLQNVSVQTDLNGEFDGGFLLQANLQDIAVGAWQGAPAARGVQGYLQANQSSGFVELDSRDFEIHLPRLFTDSWLYDSLNSRVNWAIDGRTIRVNSSIIDVRNESIHGHIQFDLYNYPDSNDEMQSELTLLIGVLELDASYKSALLPNMPRIQNTMDWLNEGLLAGNITNSGFVSRTSTKRNAPLNSGTVMSFYNVENGVLKFQPEWPPLTDIDAFVRVDNNLVDVTANGAEIENIRLGHTEAAVRPDPERGSWLSIVGEARASTDLGLAFLRNTPVRNDIGDFIDEWRGEGSVAVDIELGIPLNNPDLGTQVHVDVLSERSTLTIPEYSLSVDDLRGRVVFDTDTGLTANALSGKLFDFPIAATIDPLTRNGSNEIIGTRIVGSGRASKPALQAWQGQPQFVRDVLNFAGGEIDYLAEISIPYADEAEEEMKGTSLRLTSELLGLSLDLPYPFRKTVEQIRPLVLRLDFEEDAEWVSVLFDNKVGASLLVSENDFQGGNVVLGPDARLMTLGESVIERPGLTFTGFIDFFDYDEWEFTAERFTELSGAGESGAGLSDFLSLADVRVGRLGVVEQELENAQARVSRTSINGNEEGTADSWLVALENELVSGNFVFPDDDIQPWNISLDYLRLPDTEQDEESNQVEEEDVDILENVIPGELPAMNFFTEEFIVGDKNLGAWEFRLRSNGDSASISDLKMTTPDARITDNSRESGANLNWRYSNGMHTSNFTGLFSAGDLAKVLPGWGYDANVESANAAFTSNFQWAGSPAAFGLEKVIGNVRVEIENGRFVDIDSGSSRLFGAFSFDSLVRRLQLDFSDLYERGLAYDAINGRLDFNEGIVRSNGDFVIAGPSSRITIDGEIDLVNQTIDADMLVNVPFSQNVSVLAGILGAWPIAVSTYIASRIFRNQMDEFTTVVYRLEGPWDNPDSGFEPSEEILDSDPEDEPVVEETAAAE